jgi:hypothetical protein
LLQDKRKQEVEEENNKKRLLTNQLNTTANGAPNDYILTQNNFNTLNSNQKGLVGVRDSKSPYRKLTEEPSEN